MLTVEVLETSDLGDRSYVVHDGRVALVVDPQRDIDRIEKMLNDRDLGCVAVLETHIHNDYITGGYELSRRASAAYLVNAEDPVAFEREPVSSGEQLRFGDLIVTPMATPGHTVTHLAYFVEDATLADSPAVFTGGSLLFGSVGRTDLVDPARTEELTRAQFHSARKVAELPDTTRVFPTHGFGSFCSSGSASGGESSTIGLERQRNDALTAADEDAFVTKLIENLTAYPAYYAHMASRNLEGPGPADLSAPELVDPVELRRRIDAEEWVVDLRNRTAYASGHVEGTISIELGGSFSTYLGWLIPWGTPLTLIGESSEQVAAAQRQLVRIGIDRPAGAAIGSVKQLAEGKRVLSYPVANFDRLAEADRSKLTLLDTRRVDERNGGWIPGSVHIPLHDLMRRRSEVPQTQSVWIHCASGFRASIAASLLAGAGYDVVLVDDHYAHATELGLTSS